MIKRHRRRNLWSQKYIDIFIHVYMHKFISISAHFLKNFSFEFLNSVNAQMHVSIEKEKNNYFVFTPLFSSFSIIISFLCCSSN